MADTIGVAGQYEVTRQDQQSRKVEIVIDPSMVRAEVVLSKERGSRTVFKKVETVAIADSKLVISLGRYPVLVGDVLNWQVYPA